jgi:hypothetical protein
MADPEQRDTIQRLVRLVRVPQARRARVRAAIHRQWRRELRRARCRYFLLILALLAAAALLLAIAWRGLREWLG